MKRQVTDDDDEICTPAPKKKLKITKVDKKKKRTTKKSCANNDNEINRPPVRTREKKLSVEEKKSLRYQIGSYHFMSESEVDELRSSLLNWLSQCGRKLPWLVFILIHPVMNV